MNGTNAHEQIAKYLKKTPLLCSVPLPELCEFAKLCKFIKYEKGSVVFRLGESASKVYFVYSGEIAEFVSHNSSVEVIVKLRKKYDYMGEMGAFSGDSYADTAVALEGSTLICMYASDFLALLRNNIASMEYIVTVLIERLTILCQKLINTMYLSAEGKLAFTMINLLAGDNEKGDDSSKASGYFNITQAELAASAGIRRQTAARIMGEWRAQGIIKTARGRVYPRDPAALMEILIKSEFDEI